VARFHLQYCAALAVHGTETILPAHSLEFGQHLARPELARTLGAIEVVGDPTLTHYHQCNIELFDADGRPLARMEGRGPKGTPQNPMSDAEVVEKFLRLVRPAALPAAAAREYVRRLEDLEAQADCRWLLADFGDAAAA